MGGCQTDWLLNGDQEDGKYNFSTFLICEMVVIRDEDNDAIGRGG